MLLTLVGTVLPRPKDRESLLDIGKKKPVLCALRQWTPSIVHGFVSKYLPELPAHFTSVLMGWLLDCWGNETVPSVFVEKKIDGICLCFQTRDITTLE